MSGEEEQSTVKGWTTSWFASFIFKICCQSSQLTDWPKGSGGWSWRGQAGQAQWFSARWFCTLPPPGVSVWSHFWFLSLERMLLDLVGRVQRCCLSPTNAQDSLTQRLIYPQMSVVLTGSDPALDLSKTSSLTSRSWPKSMFGWVGFSQPM